MVKHASAPSLWQRAAGILKDRNSIWRASLYNSTAYRNPDIEKAVIRSTAHDAVESFDRRNIDRVCEWIRISPYNLPPLLRAISNRMDKTRNWDVALKGLNLMHCVINTRLPCVTAIGRLPFDLSNFKDGHAKSWPLNAFVRSYYAFLDQKSTLIFEGVDEDKFKDSLVTRELVNLHKVQLLIDLLIGTKPQSVPLVLDAMDVIILEIYDLYSKICRGIAMVLLNIYSARKSEVEMTLKIVQKASQQGEDLSDYFDICQKLGIFYASEFPGVDRIPDEGLQELKQIIMSFSDGDDQLSKTEDSGDGEHFCRDQFRTIITDKWEKFEEDYRLCGTKTQELPDLITFL